MVEPDVKRCVTFFDGQNLFHAAKAAYGYDWPNFDPVKLAEIVCRQRGWRGDGVRFYTGVPEPSDARRRFWDNRLASLGRQGVYTYTRATRHGQEKGIDVRIALDVVGLALRDAYDVALIFSQDQDLSEAAQEVRAVAQVMHRWIKVASAFPAGGPNRRGTDRTDWIPISRADYDRCLDVRDYRTGDKHGP